jgi:hypothetical protein
MADGAVHGVELHAILKVLIARRQGISDVRSVALHRGIDGSVSNVVLPVGWGNVCVGGKEAKRGEAEASENKHEKSDDDAENEFTHGSLRD